MAPAQPPARLRAALIEPMVAEEVWATHKYMPLVPKLFEKLRDAVGWDVHLLHDVHHRLTPIEAARLGKDLEPYRLFWLEDADAGRAAGRLPADPRAQHDR